jgi:hypothetical protein
MATFLVALPGRWIAKFWRNLLTPSFVLTIEGALSSETQQTTVQVLAVLGGLCVGSDTLSSLNLSSKINKRTSQFYVTSTWHILSILFL